MQDGRASIAKAVRDADHVWVLRAMARKGARVVVGGAGVVTIVMPGKATAGSTVVPGPLWASLLKRRFIAYIEGESWALTRRGRSELKKRLCTSAAASAAAVPSPQSDRLPQARPRPQFNAEESPLTWLRSRRDKDGEPLISETEFMAGERLRSDFHLARLEPRVTASWNGVGAGSGTKRAAPGVGLELQDHVVAARERVQRALAAVGPELSGILIDVCCHLKGLSDAERARSWPQRSAKVILQMALQRLARHYGLDRQNRHQVGKAHAIRHWGSDDYRPTLQSWIE